MELLDELAKRDIQLAVLSNKPDPFIQEMVVHYFPKVTFIAVAGGKDAIPLKPDPTAALEIANRCSLNVDEVAIVGDGETDIQTAINAGMCPISVSWGFRSVQTLQACGAQQLLNHPSELLALL